MSDAPIHTNNMTPDSRTKPPEMSCSFYLLVVAKSTSIYTCCRANQSKSEYAFHENDSTKSCRCGLLGLTRLRL